jgi:KaiC/GvpD/RAD55 family RecA-like ATPase
VQGHRPTSVPAPPPRLLRLERLKRISNENPESARDRDKGAHRDPRVRRNHRRGTVSRTHDALDGWTGCGKRVFALQSLVNGAHRKKEAGIFVAFEESARQTVANAATFGWDLPTLEKKKLFFLNAQLSPETVKSGGFDLIGMLNVLHAKATAMRATHIVFDGIDVLLDLLDDPVAERREIYRLRDWLLQTGLTGIITQKVGGNDADHRYGFLQFMVDCVVMLRHPRPTFRQQRHRGVSARCSPYGRCRGVRRRKRVERPSLAGRL